MDQYILKNRAVAIIVAQGVANVLITASALRRQARVSNAIIADQDERLRIYNETVDFLLERADPLTLGELNQKLDFWRVVRGRSVRPDDN